MLLSWVVSRNVYQVLGHFWALVDWISVMEFIHDLMGCGLRPFAVDIKIYQVFLGSGVPEENTMVAVRIAFCWAVAWLLDRNRASEGADMTKVGSYTVPRFKRSLASGGMVGSVVEISSINNCVCPEFSTETCAV